MQKHAWATSFTCRAQSKKSEDLRANPNGMDVESKHGICGDGVGIFDRLRAAPFPPGPESFRPFAKPAQCKQESELAKMEGGSSRRSRDSGRRLVPIESGLAKNARRHALRGTSRGMGATVPGPSAKPPPLDELRPLV
jgi:hypothetical protein